MRGLPSGDSDIAGVFYAVAGFRERKVFQDASRKDHLTSALGSGTFVSPPD